jgi:PIN domain nuclease of toxin-antitoxin system
MASSFVLDTHALLWFLEGNRRLGNRARRAIAAPENHLIVPVIVLAEASIIIEQRRTKIPSVAHLLETLGRDLRFEVYPLSLDVFRRSLSAEAGRIPELHDRLIVATALHLLALGQKVALITRDHSLSEADLLPVVW